MTARLQKKSLGRRGSYHLCTSPSAFAHQMDERPSLVAAPGWHRRELVGANTRGRAAIFHFLLKASLNSQFVALNNSAHPSFILNSPYIAPPSPDLCIFAQAGATLKTHHRHPYMYKGSTQRSSRLRRNPQCIFFLEGILSPVLRRETPASVLFFFLSAILDFPFSSEMIGCPLAREEPTTAKTCRDMSCARLQKPPG